MSNPEESNIPKFPPLSEFLQMSDAQKVFLTDQADATIRDRVPEATHAIDAAGRLAEEIVNLIPDHAKTALVVIESVYEVMGIMTVLAQSQVQQGEE